VILEEKLVDKLEQLWIVEQLPKYWQLHGGRINVEFQNDKVPRLGNLLDDGERRRRV